MNQKLYVGNLYYSVAEDELREAFSPHGTVESVKIVTDKFTGRSKGFGFVEMTTDESAEAALKAMSGQELGGRKVIVSEARAESPRGSEAPRPFGNGRGGGGYGNRPPRQDQGRRFRGGGSFEREGKRERRPPSAPVANDRPHDNSDDEYEDNKWNR